MSQKGIPSREIIINTLDDIKIPCSFDVLAKKLLQIKSKNAITRMYQRISRMIKDSQCHKTQEGYLYLPGYNIEFITGKVRFDGDKAEVISHREKKSTTLHIYPIENKSKKLIFHNDVISYFLCCVNNIFKEAVLHKVIKKRTLTLLGQIIKDNGVIMCKPIRKSYNHDIAIIASNKQKIELLDKQIVEIKLISYPEKRLPGLAKIIRLFSHLSEEFFLNLLKEKYSLCLNENQGVATNFSVTEITDITQPSNITLSEIPFITIDHDSTQDIDDAIACTSNGGNSYTLYIAIADVSNYVKIDSLEEQYARKITSSVYFTQKTYHMLPLSLAGNLCSLQVNKNRLAILCEILIGNQGIKKYSFYKACIKVRHKLSYVDVDNILEDKKTVSADLNMHLQNLFQIFQILHKKSMQMGRINIPNNTIRIDICPKTSDIQLESEKNSISKKLIAEFMILANHLCASYIHSKINVGIYRVHKEIGKKQASILQNYITRVDPTLCSLKHIHNRQDVYQLINLITSKDDVNLNSILMQYLPRAYYSSEASRHFGLNLKYYTHFTSPIRRYADFIIHHLLSSLISGKEISRNILAILKSVSEQCSKQEQVISAITNEMANYYKFVKLADNLGTHDGFYRTIVPTGMLVYLPKYDILCCVEKLPSYHKFKSLSFGAPVKIDVTSVCMVTMTISAKLLEFC